MGMSFPVSFLLGEALAKSAGATNSSDQIASGVALAAAGGGVVGIVLARQLALSRAAAAPATVTSASAPPAQAGAPPPPPDPTQSNTVANKLIDKVAADEGIDREIARRRIVDYLSQLAAAIASSTEPPDSTTSAIGRDVLRELTAIADQEAQAQGHDSPHASITHDPPSGLAVTLHGGTSKADKGGSIVAYAWTFPDDTGDSNETVTHTFARSGKYHVRLEVTDSWGNSNATSKWITVRDDSGTAD